MAKKFDEDTNKKIQELQISEQSYQQLLMQKQAFEMELNETLSASEEVEKSSDDVFKIIGQIMIKTDKKTIKEELDEKRKLLSLRLQSLEKQENSLKEKVESVRQEIMEKIEEK